MIRSRVRARGGMVSAITYLPFTASFNDNTSGWSSTYDFIFGTGGTPASGQIKLASGAATDVYFNPKGNNSGPNGNYKINKEIQSYVDSVFNTTNHVYTSDSLELTATIEGVIGPKLITRSPSSNVTNSHVIPLASTASLYVGQVVGFGKTDGFTNLRISRTFALNGTLQAGASSTITISDRSGAFTVPITVVAGGGDTNATVIAALVAAINADATLGAAGVDAYVFPAVPQCLMISFPKKSVSDPQLFGYSGQGSLDWVNATPSYSGGAAGWELRNQNNIDYIFITKITAGVSIEVSQAVTLTTSSVITFNPSLIYMLPAENASTTLSMSDTSQLSVGQCFNMGYNDSELRRINSITPNVSIVGENGFYAKTGFIVQFMPFFKAYASAASTGTVVTIGAGVPAGVEAGHQFFNYYSSTETHEPCRVISKTATTVTLDAARTVASGATLVFMPPVNSAQIWSKFRSRPKSGPFQSVAVEWDVTPETAESHAYWCALWGFHDDTDPIYDASKPSGGYEIDIIDPFNFQNNQSTNNIRFAASTTEPSSTLYTAPNTDLSQGVMRGNNLGIKRRKYGLIWEEHAIYFYVDGVLMFARRWKLHERSRMQWAMNLAIGSINNSFIGNSFFPLDWSTFPQKFKLHSFKVLEKVGSGAFTPASLGTDLKVWLDASDASTITHSSNSVSQWSSKSPATIHAYQSGAAKPTTNIRSVNGVNYLDFDGVNNWMDVSGAKTFLNSSDFDMYVVACVDDLAGSKHIIGGRDIATSDVRFGIRSAYASGEVEALCNPTYTTSDLVVTEDNGAHVFGAFRDGAVINVMYDGVLGPNAVAADVNMNVVSIGNSGTGTSFFNGGIAAVIVTAKQTNAVRNQILQYMRVKYGISYTAM